MIKLQLGPSASSRVEGSGYAYVSEPDKVGNALSRLSKHNLNRLASLAPEETNRFTSMFFDPMFKHFRIKREGLTGNKPTKGYIEDIMSYLADESVIYATVAEVAARVATSVKEGDAFMTSVTAQSPLLIPFAIAPDDNDTNLKIFAKLAGQPFNAGIAKKVIDGIKFPETGVAITPERVTLAGIAATFTAKPSRPLTRKEVIQMVDDIFAFYTLAKEVEDSAVQGAVNAAMAMHVILDAYISMLGPDSSAMSTLHQELAGQSSVVSMDVIRRITSSFATLGLTAYLAVPSLRLLHIAELAGKTAEVTKKHVPASENAYVSTVQTIELLKGVKSMMTPYMIDLYSLAGTEESLMASPLFDEPVQFLPPVFRPLITVPDNEMITSIDGPLPIRATVPIRLQTIDRAAYFSIASSLEDAMSQYRGHVMNYNVIIAQYFNNAELGLMPTNLSEAAKAEDVPSVSVEYATPFSSPMSIRPVKYNATGGWTLGKYVNRPHNMYAIIQEIIADQPLRFVFDAKGDKLPALGGTQGARFLSMPIPGVYAAFTERYAMEANITSFLDLIATQANITTRDSFFQDISLLLLFARGTDDFIHLYRALAPYLQITISLADKKGSKEDKEAFEALEATMDLAKQDRSLTAWGLPLTLLNNKQTSVDGNKAIPASQRITEVVTDPISNISVTFKFRIRTQFPKPSELTLMRVDKFAKTVLAQPVSKEFCDALGLASLLAVGEDDYSKVKSLASMMASEETFSEALKYETEWLTNTSYYHEVAAAPHIRLRTSKSFSEAFNYTPSDVKAMLSNILIISDDAEGFTQVFTATKVEPVMIVAEDEEAHSFPSLNRGQGTNPGPAPAMASTDALEIDSHTDEGQGLNPDEGKKPNESAPALQLDNTNSQPGADAPNDIPAATLVEDLGPEFQDNPDDSDEEKARKRKLRDGELAKRKKDQQDFNKETLLPKEQRRDDDDITK